MSTLDRKKAQAAMDGKLAEPDCRPAVNVSWTDERIETAKRLWMEGHSATDIAQRMGGVSRNAVIGKLHRMGLSREGRAAPAKPARIKAPKPARAPKAVKSKVSTRPKRILRADDLEREGHPIMSLTRHQCRWPVNAPPRGGEHLFCGDETVPGKSYCEGHAATARRDYIRREEA